MKDNKKILTKELIIKLAENRKDLTRQRDEYEAILKKDNDCNIHYAKDLDISLYELTKLVDNYIELEKFGVL